MTEDRNRIARDFVAAFARDGSATYVSNLDTHVEALDWGGTVLPVTVNHGTKAQTFVCSPKVGYIDYTREELSHFPNPALVPVLRAIVGAVSGLLSLSDLDRIVHVNNWMISTNLPVDLDAALVPEQTRTLTARFPRHLLAIRSLTRRHSAPLIEALEAAGWFMLPSRQVFMVDDVTGDSLTRRDARNDDQLWRRMAFACEEPTEIEAKDAQRIAELYAKLYLDKYSRLNPAYTARFVRLTRQIGMIRYLVLRDSAGTIQGFGGMHRFGQHATMPLIGYNTDLPQTLGLYRLVCHAGSLHAAAHGLHFNMSSGAGHFKLTRGATAEIEFTAFHIRHLGALRRLPFGPLRLVADKIGVPLLQRYQL